MNGMGGRVKMQGSSQTVIPSGIILIYTKSCRWELCLPKCTVETRKTLLMRAKDPDDNLAWDDFVDYYDGFIQMLLCKMDVPRSEHDDLKH